MGYGDQLMASGMARGAAARGKRIAFGDGAKIIWDHHSEAIFRGNPNIAAPGSEGAADLQWIPFYRGNRLYNHQRGDCWEWNYSFKAIPGEMFFTPEELDFANMAGRGFVVIEPNVPEFKTVAPNKQWPVARYDEAARQLIEQGRDVVQLVHGPGHAIRGARAVKTPSFRHALAVLKNASLYIGPEGGLHHGAAAVAVPAVVLFGGFIPPQVTGYEAHANLTGGAVACGSLHRCEHCKEAMAAIKSKHVLSAAKDFLRVAA